MPAAAWPTRHLSNLQGHRATSREPYRRAAAVRNPGHRPLSPVRFCQRIVVNQCHVVVDVPGGRGLRREVLIRTTGTNRVGGHEEQHHASMGNCQFPQGADHEAARLLLPSGGRITMARQLRADAPVRCMRVA
jgi:hypothetical protein